MVSYIYIIMKLNNSKYGQINSQNRKIYKFNTHIQAYKTTLRLHVCIDESSIYISCNFVKYNLLYTYINSLFFSVGLRKDYISPHAYNRLFSSSINGTKLVANFITAILVSSKFRAVHDEINSATICYRLVT